MDRFEARALTHMLVVADAAASRDWYVDVLDASVYGEYGGTSVVLDWGVSRIPGMSSGGWSGSGCCAEVFGQGCCGGAVAEG